ncbi:hypothetical protein AB0425_22480 [Actinosynnema sp. NPDC051121]
MLKRFVKWLDGLLVDEGSATVVKAVVGIMSFAVLLGAVLGNAAVKAGALVAAILLVLSAALLLLADRRELVREVESYRAIVSQLAQVASGDRNPAYRISDWDEFVAIEPNGDGRRRITIRAEVSSNDLWVVPLIQGCGWPQPAKFRNQVRVAVRRLLSGDAPGVSLTTTSTWVADGKSVLIIHFPEPLQSGTEITIAVEVFWPGMCAPLMRDQSPDKFTLRFATPVAHARYRVLLPRGFDAYSEPIGFESGNDDLVLGASVVGNGQPIFVFEGGDLPMRHDIGMRLELKRKGSSS